MEKEEVITGIIVFAAVITPILLARWQKKQKRARHRKRLAKEELRKQKQEEERTSETEQQALHQQLEAKYQLAVCPFSTIIYDEIGLYKLIERTIYQLTGASCTLVEAKELFSAKKFRVILRLNGHKFTFHTPSGGKYADEYDLLYGLEEMVTKSFPGYTIKEVERPNKERFLVYGKKEALQQAEAEGYRFYKRPVKFW